MLYNVNRRQIASIGTKHQSESFTKPRTGHWEWSILDMGPYKYRFRREFAVALEEVGPFSRVLDLASANAKFRNMLPANIFYLGADISEKAFFGLKADDSTRFRVGDVTSLPFFLADEEPFDLVVSTHTFSHLAPSLKSVALRNLISLTEVGGHLILELTKSDQKDLSADLSSLGEDLELQKRVNYRGVFSNVIESLFPASFNSSSFGRKMDVLLSYCDPPPFRDALLVYRKL